MARAYDVATFIMLAFDRVVIETDYVIEGIRVQFPTKTNIHAKKFGVLVFIKYTSLYVLVIHISQANHFACFGLD